VVAASLVTTGAAPALAGNPMSTAPSVGLSETLSSFRCHPSACPEPPIPTPVGCSLDIADRVEGRDPSNRRSGTLVFSAYVECYPLIRVTGRISLAVGHVTSGPVFGPWINALTTTTIRTEARIPIAQLASMIDTIQFDLTLTAPPNMTWTGNSPTTPSGALLQCGPFGSNVTSCSVTREKVLRPFWYVSLGDSYSSGTGTTGSEDSGPCQRTSTAYPALFNGYLQGLVGGNVDFSPLACHGATTGTMYNDQLTQVAQRSLGGFPDLITVTIGGNDLLGRNTDNEPAGFRGILEDCISRVVSSCNPSLDTAAATNVLDNAYAFIRQRTGPNHSVWVLLYPQIIPPGAGVGLVCPAFGLIDATEADRLRALWSRANQLIAQRAQQAGFVVIDTENVLAHHEICTASPWAVDLTVGSGYNSTAFHPNTTGHVAMFNAMRPPG